MKTEYIQTDFEEITPGIRRAWEIKSHAQGKKLVPLAKGERPPEEKAEAKAAPKRKKARRKAKAKSKP